MKDTALLFAIICVCCLPPGCQTPDETTDPVPQDKQPAESVATRSPRAVGVICKPLEANHPPEDAFGVREYITVSEVTEALANARGTSRFWAVISAGRLVERHPRLVPVLIRVHLGLDTDPRVAGAAGMVLDATGGPFCKPGRDELVRILRDWKLCCDKENRGNERHMRRRKALHMLCGMNSGAVGVVPAIIETDYWDCLNVERLQYIEWIGPGQPQDTPALLGLLSGREAWARYVAAICLAYHTDSADVVTAALAEAMRNEESSEMRRVMLKSLVHAAGRDQSAARIVTEALRDGSYVVRSDAAMLLAGFEGHETARAARLAAVMNDYSLQVRRQAADGLGRIASRAPESVKLLLGALTSDEPAVRLSSARALSRLGDPGWTASGLQAVMFYLSDRDQDVRLAAVRTVAQIGPGAHAAAGMLAEMLGDRRNRDLAEDICTALGGIGPRAAAAPALVEAVDAGGRHLERPAAEALRSIGSADDALLARLTRILKDADREETTRLAAAGALLRLAPGDSTSPQDALAFVHRQVRFRPALDLWAIELLVDSRPRSPSTVRLLREFLASFAGTQWAPSVTDGPMGAMLAAEGLARSGDTKAAHIGVAILIWMMKTGRPDFDLAAMESSGRAFWDSDPIFRKAMRRANLGRCGFRRLAIEAIGRVGPAAAEAIPHLEEMTKWKDLRLRPVAAETLRKLRDIAQKP